MWRNLFVKVVQFSVNSMIFISHGSAKNPCKGYFLGGICKTLMRGNALVSVEGFNVADAPLSNTIANCCDWIR